MEDSIVVFSKEAKEFVYALDKALQEEETI